MKTNILIILILFSCNVSDNNTKKFNNYLKDIHGLEMKSNHVYIVYSRYRCHNCLDDANRILEENLVKNTKENYSIIVQTTDVLTDKLIKNVTVLIDKSGEIDYLDLGIFNLTIIKTNNHKISLIKSFQAGEIEKIPDYL